MVLSSLQIFNSFVGSNETNSANTTKFQRSTEESTRNGKFDWITSSESFESTRENSQLKQLRLVFVQRLKFRQFPGRGGGCTRDFWRGRFLPCRALPRGASRRHEAAHVPRWSCSCAWGAVSRRLCGTSLPGLSAPGPSSSPPLRPHFRQLQPHPRSAGKVSPILAACLRIETKDSFSEIKLIKYYHTIDYTVDFQFSSSVFSISRPVLKEVWLTFWSQGTLLIVWKICGTVKLMIQNTNENIPRRNNIF